VSLDTYELPLSKNPHQLPKKRTIQLGDAFEDTAFKPGFEIVEL
jgi:hypothetical protein